MEQAVGDGPRLRFHDSIGRKVACHSVDAGDNHLAAFKHLIDSMKIIGRVRRVDFGNARDADFRIDRRGIRAPRTRRIVTRVQVETELGVVLEDRLTVGVGVGETESSNKRFGTVFSLAFISFNRNFKMQFEICC